MPSVFLISSGYSPKELGLAHQVHLELTLAFCSSCCSNTPYLHTYAPHSVNTLLNKKETQFTLACAYNPFFLPQSALVEEPLLPSGPAQVPPAYKALPVSPSLSKVLLSHLLLATILSL